MNLFRRILAAIAPPVVTDAPSERAEPAMKRQRPVSSSLVRVTSLLLERPDLTAGELAGKLSITPDYARRLLRRAQANLPASPALVAVVGRPGRGMRRRELADLHERLEHVEERLAALASTPPPNRGTWNLPRRAEVLRLAGDGVPANEIAVKLSAPPGEVDFILKVDRLLQGAN